MTLVFICAVSSSGRPGLCCEHSREHPSLSIYSRLSDSQKSRHTNEVCNNTNHGTQSYVGEGSSCHSETFDGNANGQECCRYQNRWHEGSSITQHVQGTKSAHAQNLKNVTDAHCY